MIPVKAQIKSIHHGISRKKKECMNGKYKGMKDECMDKNKKGRKEERNDECMN